jgi:hypothetical protein
MGNQRFLVADSHSPQVVMRHWRVWLPLVPINNLQAVQVIFLGFLQLCLETCMGAPYDFQIIINYGPAAGCYSKFACFLITRTFE